MRTILVLAGVLGGVVPVKAQTPPPNSQPVLRETVTVTATLEEELVSEVPASVDVITAEEIEARGDTSLSEILATVPGLTVVRSGVPGQATSLFSRGTESDHTLILWNGIELNDPYFGGFNWAFLPTEGIERVEVVRGPFSALYGSDALGGVVQVISSSIDGASLRLEAGEDSYSRAAVTAGWGGETARLDVAGHLRRGDGAFDNSFFDSDEVVARASWTLAPGKTLGIVTRFNESDTGIPFSGGAASPERTISWTESEIAVPFEAELDRWRIEARLSRVEYESSFRDPFDLFGFTSSDTESTSVRARTVASYRHRENLRVSFGAETERLEVSDRSVFGVSLDGARQKTWALFGETALRFGKVRIDLGVRHDDNDVYGNQTSPKITLSTPLGQSARVWASYGEGFRAPSIGELFFPFSGSQELQPETSESFEIGVERQAGSWSARLVGFENRLTDLIDFDFISFRNINVGRARTRGLEASVRFAGRRFEGRWNATYLDAEDLDTGLALLRRPEHSSNLVLSSRLERWLLNLTASYVGERPDVHPVFFSRAESDSYTRVDVAATWRYSDRLSPYLRLDNAFDREYAEALGFPAAGLSLVVGVALDFQ